MNINQLAPPVPRGVLAGVRAEADPSQILAQIRNAVDTRLGAVESDIDKLTNRMAGKIVAGAGKKGKKQQLAAAMKVIGEFARHRSSAPIQLHEFLAGRHDLPQAAMSVGSNPDGGYTVIPEMESAIITAGADVSPMRGLATVVTISTDAFEFLADPSMAEVNWVGESDTRTQTSGLNFYKTRIPVQEMTAQPPVTQSLLDDSFVDLGTYLTGRIGNGFALKEAAAFTVGNGVMQPRGFLMYPSTSDDDFNSDGSRNRAWGTLQYYAVGASSPSDTQLADGFVSLAAQLRSPYRANACWMMSRQMYAVARTLKDSQNRYLLSTDGRIADAQPELLCGFPIGGGTQATMFDEGMPTATGANALVAALGDFRQAYLIVDRAGIKILRDPFSAKPYVLFYTTKRVGGGVQNFDAIKLLKCSTS